MIQVDFKNCKFKDFKGASEFVTLNNKEFKVISFYVRFDDCTLQKVRIGDYYLKGEIEADNYEGDAKTIDESLDFYCFDDEFLYGAIEEIFHEDGECHFDPNGGDGVYEVVISVKVNKTLKICTESKTDAILTVKDMAKREVTSKLAGWGLNDNDVKIDFIRKN